MSQEAVSYIADEDQMVTESPAESEGELEQVRQHVEQSLREVTDRLASLRATRKRINDRIRDLVAEHEMLTRMARVAKSKKVTGDE